MRFLLTGAAGMLGAAFAERLGASAVIAARAELDIRNVTAIDGLVARVQPDVLVNCAAHVDAEAAEVDPDLAYATNAVLPGLLATACRRLGVRLVHFSSTGCYGAWKQTPYTEEDPVQPTTAHHRSKVAGETAIRDSGCEYLILRTGWLFGGGAHHKKNFVWHRLVEASRQGHLLSDAEQVGNPTYVGDVVEQSLELVRLRLTGLYNCVSRGQATRFDYVSRIVSASGFDCRLERSGAFRRVAPVSPNEMAINYRLSLLGLDRMPEWSTSLDAYIAQIHHWPEWRALVAHGAEV